MQHSSAALPGILTTRLCRSPPLASWSARVQPRKVCFRGHNYAFFHGFCAFGNDANRSIGRVCAAAKTTERRTYAWMDAARARPRLLSPLSLWIPPALGKDTGAPGSAAVSSGHLPPRGSHDQARFGRSPPTPPPSVWRWEAHCSASRQQDEAIWSSKSEAEGGKPRRGSAFKETGARYQGQWSASVDQVTNPNAGVIYRGSLCAWCTQMLANLQQACRSTNIYNLLCYWPSFHFPGYQKRQILLETIHTAYL